MGCFWKYVPFLLKIGDSPDNRPVQIRTVAPIAIAAAGNLSARAAD
jgi:hypothetical protein